MFKPFIFATLLAISGCVIVPYGVQQPLSAPEVSNLVQNRTFSYSGATSGRLFSGQIELVPGGSLLFRTDTGRPEGGTWEQRGNLICMRFAAFNAGEEDCFSLFAQGGGTYFTSHGFRLVPL